jgi:hypothetical protein
MNEVSVLQDKNMKRFIFISLLLLITFGLHAQTEKISPAYWVVETNLHQKNYSIIKLYDSSNHLIHEVRMDGYYFDVTRAKHRRKLDLLLQGYFSKPELSAKMTERTRAGAEPRNRKTTTASIN